MKNALRSLGLVGLIWSMAVSAAAGGALLWDTLTSVPDPIGFAGPYAGVSEDALILAGGANFPDKPPWDDGTKVWYDSVFVLSEPKGKWVMAGRLPRPLGYGVSLTTEDGLLCIGGGDAKKHYADAFLLKWTGHTVEAEQLPPMPKPSALFCGAMFDGVAYVAGGKEQPDSPGTLKTFYALDLKAPNATRAWQELEPWPGPPRMLAVAGAWNGCFYLISGTDLVPGKDGKPVRKYLRDAYKYRPGKGWTTIADIPRAAVAAPTPAPVLGQSHLLVLSGDDGTHVDKDLREAHPGFPNDVLGYDTTTDTWAVMGAVPRIPTVGVWPQVTVPALKWRGMIVVPNGEVKPGIRTRLVLAAKVPD